MTSRAESKRNRSRGTVFLIAISALSLAIGCGDPSSSKPSTGGSTHDFGGNTRACTQHRTVDLDERIEALGYSPREAVEIFGDSQTFRVDWVPNCSSDSCDVRENPDDRDLCELDENQLPSFVGMQSEITVTVRPTGAPAAAFVPNPAESADTCTSGVNVAVDVVLESDDATVDATALGDLSPFDIEHVQLNVNVNAEDLGGKLAGELPEGSLVDVTMESVPDGFHAHFWVLVPDGDRAGRYQLLFEGLMLPDKDCRSPFQGSIQG